MLVQHLLEQSAARHPDHTALVCGRRLTYAELDAEAAAIAGALAAAGVARGDRVVLYMDNAAETVIGLFAVLKAGAVFSIVNPTTKRAKLARILDNCRPTAMIVDQGRLTAIEGVEREIPSLRYLITVGEADGEVNDVPNREAWTAAVRRSMPAPAVPMIDVDLATIIYTSGSTGTPKGVMSTHRNVLAATTSVNGYLQNTTADVILDVLPLSFDYGLYQIFLAFQAGATVVLEKGFLYPAQVVQRIRDQGVTGFPGVPTIFSLMLQQRRKPYDLPSLRYLTNTAAALPVSHIERIRDAFPQARLFSMYGLTECKRISYLPPEQLERRPGSVGIAIPNTEVYLVDPDGNRLPHGSQGELVVRGSHVMRGYWGDPETTARRYRPGPIAGEMVLYTGDLLRTDDQGYLYFIGRMDDIIKSRGEKVSPKEVEAIAYALDGVLDAAVLGVPDPVLGEAVRLVVSLADGCELTERQIRLHCQQNLEDYMVPKLIEIWPALPKNTSGKIDKLAIRAGDPVGAGAVDAAG